MNSGYSPCARAVVEELTLCQPGVIRRCR